jgi:hypothetical protein
MPSEAPDLAVRPELVTEPGLAIHVGADILTTPEQRPFHRNAALMFTGTRGPDARRLPGRLGDPQRLPVPY